MKLRLFVRVNVVDSDGVVGEGSEELVAVGGPGQSGAWEDIGSQLGFLLLLILFNDDLGNCVIGIVVQVEDVDTIFARSGDPLSGGVEGNLADGGTSVQGSAFFLEVVQVPKLDGIFFTSGGNVVTSGGNGQRVDVFVVGLEGVLDQEVGVPDLESAVPAGRGEVGALLNGGVSDAGDPVGVVVLLVGVLAVSDGVPELEGLVSTTGDDLSVIVGEANGVDFLLVTNEDSGGLASSQVPKSEGLVP